jgi:hypothetical protein
MQTDLVVIISSPPPGARVRKISIPSTWWR